MLFFFRKITLFHQFCVKIVKLCENWRFNIRVAILYILMISLLTQLCYALLSNDLPLTFFSPYAAHAESLYS